MVPKALASFMPKKMDFDNFMHGGDQEEKHRAGTENLISITRHGGNSYPGSMEHLEENLERAQDFTSTLLTYRTDFYQMKPAQLLCHQFGISQSKNDSFWLKWFWWIFHFNRINLHSRTIQPSHVLQAMYGRVPTPCWVLFGSITSGQTTSCKEIQLFTKLKF